MATPRAHPKGVRGGVTGGLPLGFASGCCARGRRGKGRTLCAPFPPCPPEERAEGCARKTYTYQHTPFPTSEEGRWDSAWDDE